MLKIGLTGGVGCGKSTVAKLFKHKGLTVVDADLIAREVVTRGSEALQQIVLKFGKEILTTSGELNRKALREKVFSDHESLEWLNKLLHPRIRQRLIHQAENAPGDYVILDIPLLFENHLESLVDRVLVIDIPVQEQIKRVVNRDSVSEETVKSIISRQATREHRLTNADDIIDNTVPQEILKNRVDELHQNYLILSQS